MNIDVVVAIVSGAFTLIGVIITVIYGSNKTKSNIEEQTSLTLYRIEQLEKKQDKHNSLIERMYAVEEKVDILIERQNVSNHRIDDLEEYHKN